MMGMGRDKLVETAGPVFGESRVAAVAQVLGYPAEIVGAGLSRLVGKDVNFDLNAMLDVGSKVYGTSGLGKFAKGAGAAVEDVFAWAGARNYGAQSLGFALNGSGFAQDKLLGLANKAFGSNQLGLNQAGGEGLGQCFLGTGLG